MSPSLSWCLDDAGISAYLEKNREEGSGPGIIVSKAEGVLVSGRVQVAILYTYQIGESRNRSFFQYVAVFDSPSFSIPQRIRVGVNGAQTFDTISIENETITLHGKKWVKKDPLCCPSEEAILKLYYSSDGFLPMANSPNPSLKPDCEKRAIP